ncbi:hypothetical protein CGZ96_11065 [Enemella evansiae]|uniref:DUF488 domain-containing protein n=1 Tax=Enemella evansiae TaxID=2016499 RepID=UPI000B96CB3E|nr:DUF488 domain-containing protein [Enemella evansiae]OYN96833.1 hypothetical protein CGZ96_11065 [Enemella evansiae]
MGTPVFTIGHSNRSLEEFIGLLQETEIERVVDVRRLPGSTRYPWFDESALAGSLAAQGIALDRLSALTGRRPVSKDVPFEVNAWWENRSFHNFADHALSAEFAEALATLQEWGALGRTAVMCSEAVWWRCHRRIIADHLLAHGADVRHIMGPKHVDRARLSEGAVIGGDLEVTYPATERSTV